MLAFSGCLIEILASRTNAELLQLKAAYKKDLGRDLEKDLESDTSGHFKKLLLSLVNGCRDESSGTNRVREHELTFYGRLSDKHNLPVMKTMF